MSTLSLAIRPEADRTIVALTGDLDLATVSILREAARAELNAPACTVLVLELTNLTFLDSTGLGCWIELRNRAEADGKSLELESIPPAAMRTVSIAGLADLFGLNASA